MEKFKGQKCPDCADGVYVENPKTGKIFCDKKCWLNKPQGAPQGQKAYNPQYQQKIAQEAVSGQKQAATDWDKISWGKCKHAYLVESFKYKLNMNEAHKIEGVEELAEKWADMSMRKKTGAVDVAAPADYDIPVIDVAF
jgi:hypothetical protein